MAAVNVQGVNVVMHADHMFLTPPIIRLPYFFSKTCLASYLYSIMAQSKNTEDKDRHYFVTRESQENSTSSRKESYAGLRDLTDLQKIEELDIVGPDGTLRGIKNRVRAGRATFENRGALVKVKAACSSFLTCTVG